ncbi:MAG: BON domain-containing protein [bacterium]|jgi:osmotically-inducible protein OsmY|nr:BON domain-containing protein [bacterium]MDD3806373.1 BON domain-containing protein [bacterium]MDD4153540.1 BON domain-containing protein [bacterium]MDD4559011.1 BON domain-containing protein [bacterium]
MERELLLNQVRNRLAAEVGALDILVEIVDDSVRLSGEVDDPWQIEAAIRALCDLAGGRRIINNLAVRQIKRPGIYHEMIISEKRERR